MRCFQDLFKSINICDVDWMFRLLQHFPDVTCATTLGRCDGFSSYPICEQFDKSFWLAFHGQFVSIKCSAAEKTVLGSAVSYNHQYKVDTAEWFHQSQPTGGGRQLGLSRPVRTETVNTAMAPALLSGTNGRGGLCSERTHLSLPSSFPHRAKKAFSCLSVRCNVRQDLQKFNYCFLLAAPVIFLFPSHALGASRCRALFQQNYLFRDEPARAETPCSYRAVLDPFRPPFCRNLITLHLGECHYKLWGYSGAVSNDCSIKQRAPTRHNGSNKAK